MGGTLLRKVTNLFFFFIHLILIWTFFCFSHKPGLFFCRVVISLELLRCVWIGPHLLISVNRFMYSQPSAYLRTVFISALSVPTIRIWFVYLCVASVESEWGGKGGGYWLLISVICITENAVTETQSLSIRLVLLGLQIDTVWIESTKEMPCNNHHQGRHPVTVLTKVDILY